MRAVGCLRVQLIQHIVGRARRGFNPARLIAQSTSLGKTLDGQTVPPRDKRGVHARRFSQRALGQQRVAHCAVAR